MKFDENKEEKGEDENIPKAIINASEIMKKFRQKEDRYNFCREKSI